MKLKFAFLFCLLAFTNNVLAQADPVMIMLSDENLQAVNTDQTSFIPYLKTIIEGIDDEFKQIKSTQHIGVVFVAHKTGKPTIELYGKPAIAKADAEKIVNKLLLLPHKNTKFVDFPFLYVLNTAQDSITTVFKGIETTEEKAAKAFEQASLKEKNKLLRDWAAQEVIPILSALAAETDIKFAGVKHFGELMQKTDFQKPQNIDKLINKNPDYWRATLEMEVGNQVIVTNKIFALVAQGKLDYAIKFLEIIPSFSTKKTFADGYLKTLKSRLGVLTKGLKADIEKGIVLHDEGSYDKAMAVYKNVLAQYPNSAWAAYELYFSKNALEQQNGTRDKSDRSDWDKAKIEIYTANPLYNLDVRASTAEQAYLLFRRNSMDHLFKDEDKAKADLYEYANIAMDLGVYDFAAQIFWCLTVFDGKNEKALPRFLYCLEKLEVTNVKDNFKGNHNKEFKSIEKEQIAEMKSSAIYKSFKK